MLRHYESELAAVVALSFFIPLLIGTGGNAGSQTVTTIIRSLALREIRLRDAWRVLAREAERGRRDRVLLGAVAFGRALLWGAHMPLAATVAITVLAICIVVHDRRLARSRSWRSGSASTRRCCPRR